MALYFMSSQSMQTSHRHYFQQYALQMHKQSKKTKLKCYCKGWNLTGK